jgi:AAA+ superfamily predicted ATPase
MLGLLANPTRLQAWVQKHHPEGHHLLSMVHRRPPLVVLAGDVGSGKSELAESIGDEVARQEKIDVVLLPLSLSSRGSGRVGEMTQLLASAFETTFEEARKLKPTSGAARGAVLLLIDEADALAQSRVNALIRGVNRLANGGVPAAVIMCTNRLSALDPAVRRRAADIMLFARPDDRQRRSVLHDALSPLGFSEADIEAMVAATGPTDGRSYGFAFSDIVQRLLPAVVLDAYPDAPVAPARAIQIAHALVPTPPFREEA